MKIPILPAVALLSLLALHAAQGAALGGAEEDTTVSNYAAGSEIKGLRSAAPDSQ
uniref:Keratinocyte differentiation associated protein n=1 Tax=Peromyscus maniculatus bairdii TaxID=230844 RepID=A0A8C8TH11_PERMB